MLDADRERRVVVFQAAQVVAPEEAGAVDRGVEGAAGKGKVDVGELGLGWGGRREESGTVAGADG